MFDTVTHFSVQARHPLSDLEITVVDQLHLLLRKLKHDHFPLGSLVLLDYNGTFISKAEPDYKYMLSLCRRPLLINETSL